MTGPSDALAAIRTVLWRDSGLEGLVVDDDTVTITLLESTGHLKKIRCRGYIGYQVVGFWDESIVDSARVSSEHAFIEENLKSIRERHPWPLNDSGSPERNTGDYFVLEIRLDDGAVVLIAAASLEVV